MFRISGRFPRVSTRIRRSPVIADARAASPGLSWPIAYGTRAVKALLQRERIGDLLAARLSKMHDTGLGVPLCRGAIARLRRPFPTH